VTTRKMILALCLLSAVGGTRVGFNSLVNTTIFSYYDTEEFQSQWVQAIRNAVSPYSTGFTSTVVTFPWDEVNLKGHVDANSESDVEILLALNSQFFLPNPKVFNQANGYNDTKFDIPNLDFYRGSSPDPDPNPEPELTLTITIGYDIGVKSSPELESAVRNAIGNAVKPYSDGQVRDFEDKRQGWSNYASLVYTAKVKTNSQADANKLYSSLSTTGSVLNSANGYDEIYPQPQYHYWSRTVGVGNWGGHNPNALTFTATFPVRNSQSLENAVRTAIGNAVSPYSDRPIYNFRSIEGTPVYTMFRCEVCARDATARWRIQANLYSTGYWVRNTVFNSDNGYYLHAKPVYQYWIPYTSGTTCPASGDSGNGENYGDYSGGSGGSGGSGSSTTGIAVGVSIAVAVIAASLIVWCFNCRKKHEKKQTVDNGTKEMEAQPMEAQPMEAHKMEEAKFAI